MIEFEVVEKNEMIKEINKNKIDECVQLVRVSFKTVADELGFTEVNAPRSTAFSTDTGRLLWQQISFFRWKGCYL